MKKFFSFNILITFCLFLFLSKVYAETINSIEIKGNDRIPNETIIMFSDVKIGQVVNKNETNDILKKIYNSNFFKNVNISVNDNVLTIIVEENPIIENITINGVKAKKIKKALNDQLQLKSRSSYNELIVSQDMDRISNQLKVLGYYFSKVETKVEDIGNNKVNIIYDIVMGDKAKIKKISFVGDKVFKDKKLKSIIISEEYKFWKFLSGKKFLNQEMIAFDERLIKNFYLNKGYYNIQINSSFAKLVNESEFELVYNISANQKFNFDKISIELPSDFDPINFDDLKKLFAKIKGEPYSINIISNILDEIDNIILSEEFKSIESTVEEIVEENKINLVFKILESEKIFVKRINIYGNNVTQENVIRNQLLIDEGDQYNAILANKSINNIKSLNIFKSVVSETIDDEINGEKIIEITIEEKATGEILAGAGVGTDGNSINFAVKENNYLGKGIKLDSSLTLSTDTIKGLFSVKNPNFNNSDKSVYARAQALETDRLTESGYKSNKTGFAFGTSFEYQDDLFFGLGQSSFYEKIETNSTASTRQKKQEGNYWDTFITLDLDYDKRNQKFKTTDGYRSYYSVDLPIISENNSLTNLYNISYYNELYDENVSKISLYLKATTSLTNDDVKLSERLYLPSNKLRGFVKGKVGPKDGNDFIGGNYAASLNISSTLPQILPSAQNVDFLMFMDIANIWGVDYDSSLNDTNKIRSAVGLGVDWFTLIGPLNFSLALPISKAETDKTETFKFNLGTTF